MANDSRNIDDNLHQTPLSFTQIALIEMMANRARTSLTRGALRDSVDYLTAVTAVGPRERRYLEVQHPDLYDLIAPYGPPN